jgi:hypothetical protein
MGFLLLHPLSPSPSPRGGEGSRMAGRFPLRPLPPPGGGTGRGGYRRIDITTKGA